ncbi:MAG TPA: hypothetical protein VF189_00845 [Patescibacteria group bacterium]
MTAEQMPYVPEQTQITQPPEKQRNKKEWETINIGGEEFKVKKDFIWPQDFNGVEIPFKSNVYRHEGSNTQIVTLSLGLDNPVNEPAIVRADYGCFCMEFPDSSSTRNHDCKEQKNLMIATLAEIKSGTIAFISDIVANGHGPDAALAQSTAQYEARQNGIHEPSMHEFYKESGYEPIDKRRHDIVSMAIADTVGKERPVIAAMDSNTKVQELKNAGLNVVEGIRVSLVTDLSGRNEHSLRRDNYAERPDVYKTGAYLKFDRPNGQSASIPLVKETYDILYRPNSLDLPRRVPVLTSQVVN